MAREIALDVHINERYHLMVLISENSLIADLRSEIQSVAREVFPKLRDKQVAVIKGNTGAILPDRYKVGQLLENGSKVFSFSSDYKRSKNRKCKFLDSECACRKVKRKRLSKHKWLILRRDGKDRLLNCSEGRCPSPGQTNERENLRENRESVDQNEQNGKLPDEILTLGVNISQDKERKAAGIKGRPSSVISHHCSYGGSGDGNANVKDGRFDDDGGGEGDSDGHKNDGKAERGGRRNCKEMKSKYGEKKTGKNSKEDTSTYRKFDEEVALPSGMPVIEKNLMEEGVIRRHSPATSSTEVMLSALSDKDLLDLHAHHQPRKRKVNEDSVAKVTEWLCARVKPLQSNGNQAANEDNCSGCETVSVGSWDNEAYGASQRKSLRILTGKADKTDNKVKCTKEENLRAASKNGERKEALVGKSEDDNRLCSERSWQSKKDWTEPPLVGVVSDVVGSGPRVQTLRCQIRLTKLPVGANGTKLTGNELIDRTPHDQSGDLNVQERCGTGVSPTEVAGPITRSQREKNKTFVVRDMGVQTSVTSVVESSGSEVESGVTDNEDHSVNHEIGVNGDDDMNDVSDDDCIGDGDDHIASNVIAQEAVLSEVESREPSTGRVRRQHKQDRLEAPSNVLVSATAKSSSKARNLTSQMSPKNVSAGKGDGKGTKLLLRGNNDHCTAVEKRDEVEDNSQETIKSPVELTESVDRRVTRSQHAAKSTTLLATQCGLREDREGVVPLEGDLRSRKMSESEELDSKGMRKTVKQMETEETRGNDVQTCSEAAKSDLDFQMPGNSNGEEVETKEVNTKPFISKYHLRFSTGRRLDSVNVVKKGKTSQECDSSSKKGLNSAKEKVSVGENGHEARSVSKETGSMGLRCGTNLAISDDEAPEQRSDLSETRNQQNIKYSGERGQSESMERLQADSVQNRARAHICQTDPDEGVAKTWSALNESFDSGETLKDIDTLNCARQEKNSCLSADQVFSENDSESETLRGSDDEEAGKVDAMECSMSGQVDSQKERGYSVVPVKQPFSQEAESNTPRTLRSILKEGETSKKKQLRSTFDGNTTSPKSRLNLEILIDRTPNPPSTAVGGTPAKRPTKAGNLQSTGKDKTEQGKSKKLDVLLPDRLKSDFSEKGHGNRSANEGSSIEKLTHKQHNGDWSADSGSESEGGEDASGVLVGRLKPFKRGKHVMWWEKGDEMKDHDDGGKCNMEENINDQTKAFRTKVDGEYYKEQPQKRTKKKVDSKTGREKEMDGKREVLSKENESKENRKIKGKDIVCDEVKAKVGQEIRMESECETTEDNRKEKIHEKTESDFAEEEFEGKETYRKKMNKTTHKRVGSESEQKERNEDIGEKGKALKRKLDNNSSCCEYVIKSNQKRTRDIAKSVEKDPKLMEFGLEDEESKQNSMISKTKERKKKKQTAESSTVELAASNTEKTKHDSSCSKNSKQSAVDGAGEVKSSKVDKNGGNVQQQSSVSMESENSKTRKKATSAIPREILQKSIPVDSTQVENEKKCASQNEKVKKRRKQKKETSLKESNGLGFHDAQDLNHESTVSKEIRKTRKNEITEISRGKDNELVIYNTEVRGTTDENERISSEELVVCKRDEKTKKRKKGRAIGLDDKKDASVLDKIQVLPGESALGRKKEDNREEAGLTRTEKAKKRKPQSKKCSLENGIDLVIDNKPESSQKTEKCEGRSQELTVSINVKTAKEKKKEGMKIEEKNKEKLLSRSRAEKSEIPEQTDGQEQCTKQESSGIKGTKRKTRREKVEPVSKEKSKAMLDNDSLIQNGAKEKEDDLFSTSMEHSGDKATSKKKTKSGLSLMDLVQDGLGDDSTNVSLLVQEVFDIVKDIKDPEFPQTLEELNVVEEKSIKVEEIRPEEYVITIEFKPTVPHCSLATLIGLCLRVKLERSLPYKFKLDIFLTKGTHSTEDEINKQINDKERIAAAMENPNLKTIVEGCICEDD